MKIRPYFALIFFCCFQFPVSLVYAQGQPTPGIDDGRSDYRYAWSDETVRKFDAEKYKEQPQPGCGRFEPQYVRNFVDNKQARIFPGDTYSVFLKKVYFGKLHSSGLGLFGNTAKEAAILLNIDINASSIKKSSADYGKLIYYADSLSSEQVINQSFSPVATVKLASDAEAMLLDISVVEFEHANSPLAAYSGEAGQRFHAKLDTHSRASWTVGA